MEETILTVDQVAQVLQVHPFTVLKFIKQGRLKAAKLGRVYRVRRSDVDKFIGDLADGPNATPEPAPPSKKGRSGSKARKPSAKDVPHASSLTDESKGVPLPEEHASHEDNDRNPDDHYVIDFTF